MIPTNAKIVLVDSRLQDTGPFAHPQAYSTLAKHWTKKPLSTVVTIEQSEKWCRAIARSHYENFVVASFLLPRRLRQPFYNLYAFCRVADDLADESASADEAICRLAELQTLLDGIFFGSQVVGGPWIANAVIVAGPAAGQPLRLLVPAWSRTITAFDLPKQPFDQLLSAFRQDQQKTRYADIEELLQYCRRSANPVGRLVLHLTGTFSERNAEFSDAICTGLQLANFWQDVRRDLAIARIYLPQTEMDRFGVTETMLAETTRTASQTPAPLKRLVRSECERAKSFFHQGLPLVEAVPPPLGRNFRLFVEGGLATIKSIEAIDYDVLRNRPTVSKWTRARLLMKSLFRFG